MRENKKLLLILIIFITFVGIVIYDVISSDINKKKAEESINYLTYEQYEKKLNSEQPVLVVLTQTGCTHCEHIKSVFKKINDKYNISIDVLNITDLSSDERTSLLASLDYLREEQWGTPLSLVLKGKNIVDKLNGYRDFDDYVAFLKNNGLVGD